MTDERPPSPREEELLDAAYRYALTHGLADLSLRPLATAIGSSPRVLLYLFESKDGLVRALLARARADELAMLRQLREEHAGADLMEAATRIWSWLEEPAHRDLLTLWLEGYTRSLTDPAGPWAGFAERTVRDWLDVLRDFQPRAEQDTPAGSVRRAAALAILRGGLLDLLATDESERVGTAVRQQIRSLERG